MADIERDQPQIRVVDLEEIVPESEQGLEGLQGIASSWRGLSYMIWIARTLPQKDRDDVGTHFLAHIALRHLVRPAGFTLFRNASGCFTTTMELGGDELQGMERGAVDLSMIATGAQRAAGMEVTPEKLLVRRFAAMNKVFGLLDPSHTLTFRWGPRGLPVAPRLRQQSVFLSRALV